jgi:hypothetical protein
LACRRFLQSTFPSAPHACISCRDHAERVCCLFVDARRFLGGGGSGDQAGRAQASL